MFRYRISDISCQVVIKCIIPSEQIFSILTMWVVSIHHRYTYPHIHTYYKFIIGTVGVESIYFQRTRPEWDFSLFFYGRVGVFFAEKVKNTMDGIDAWNLPCTHALEHYNRIRETDFLRIRFSASTTVGKQVNKMTALYFSRVSFMRTKDE